jgi:ParB-like chromosome segregation protein Spo0J
MSDYQVMPPLTDDEYATLCASIQQYGVLVPVVRDQHGNLIDGHHRKRAADELGVKYRVDMVMVQDGQQARTLARSYNMARRHLNRAQKRQLIADEIHANPGRSDREIGRLLGVDHKTVGSVRHELSGEFPQPDERREFHPLTEWLPVMLGVTDEDLADLAESVKQFGLIQPITLHQDGRILDGRLRYLGCVRAKIRPTYETLPARYDDRMILEFLWSRNMVRQQLTPDEKQHLRQRQEFHLQQILSGVAEQRGSAS